MEKFDSNHEQSALKEGEKSVLRGLAQVVVFGGVLMFGGKALDRMAGIEEGDSTISLPDRMTQIKALTAGDGLERGSVFVVKDEHGVPQEIQYVTGSEERTRFALGPLMHPSKYKQLQEAQKIIHMHSHPILDEGAPAMPSIQDLAASTQNDFEFSGEAESIVVDGPRTWHIEVDEENPNQKVIGLLQEKTVRGMPSLNDLSPQDFEIFKAYADGKDVGEIEETFKTFPGIQMEILKDIDAQLNTPEGFYCFANLERMRGISDLISGKGVTPEQRESLIEQYRSIAQDLGYKVTYTIDETLDLKK